MVAAPTGVCSEETLRQGLRRATRATHDMLDCTLGPKALESSGGYAEFLRIQYAARRPIETWATMFQPPQLRPPAVADLIAQDLAALQETLPLADPFSFPDGADPLGLAWAIGGSALGNRAMLTRVRGAGISTETRFMADRRMAQYFTGLLPELDQPASLDRLAAAVRAADAVFATFLHAAGKPALDRAA